MKEISGGETVVASCDFWQTVPVVRHDISIEVIENSVNHSFLWLYFVRITLNENFHICNNDNSFKKWLLSVGYGKRCNSYKEANEMIEIPTDILSKEEDIIKEIFGNKITINDKTSNGRVILAPKNNDVIDINHEILNIMEGCCFAYLSIDTAEDDNEENLDIMLPTEFSNSSTPNGLLPHKLQLKVGAIVILLIGCSIC